MAVEAASGVVAAAREVDTDEVAMPGWEGKRTSEWGTTGMLNRSLLLTFPKKNGTPGAAAAPGSKL